MFVEAVAAFSKRGGLARFGLAHGATTDTLDPTGYPDTGTQVPLWGAMANGLTEVDWQGNIGGGGNIAVKKNQNGVVIHLTSTTAGLSLTLAAEGMKISLVK
jgi:hypothetical protein